MNLNYFRILQNTTSLQKQVCQRDLFHFSSFREQMKKYGQNSISKGYDQSKYPQEFMGTTDSIIRRRREQKNYLDLEEKQKEAMQIFVAAYTDTVIEFQLFFHHTNQKSQELDAILNYYQIAYKRNMNPMFIEHIVKSNKLQDQEEPIFKVNVSLDPTQFYCGNKDILKFLIDNNFIIIPKHLTYSVYAQQGVEHAEKTNQNLDIMFYHPSLTFENLFKSTPETYKDGGQNFLLVKAMARFGKSITKEVFKNIRKLYKEKEAYKQSRQNFIEHMTTWKHRLGDNDYHGGQSPDEADFAMYGVLKAKYNSRSFQMFMERNLDAPVRRWFVRMQQNCQYEKDRTLYDE